ncbi:MAG: TIGR03118 family protein [Pyrinomonadaceae bacterium]
MSMHAQLLHATRRSTAAKELMSARPARRLPAAAISFVLTLGALFGLATSTSAQHYQQTNLVSDVPGMAATTDPHLVNPWGIARSQTSPWWVADNGTGVSTLYTGTGQMLSLVVTIPPPPGGTPPASPTGIVFNGSSDFNVAPGKPARFIFVTEDGTIAGWNQMADPTNAIIKVNNAGTAIYKGATIAQRAGANLLYVANFFGGTVDVFDTNFAPVILGGSAFIDPNLPAGFAPFNVQTIGGKIYVAYAKQDEEKEDEVAGAGLGFVDAFDADGTLQMRLRSGPWLNAPWGIVLAPADFGLFGNRLLVGQFGSGQIASFDPKNGNFLGLLHGPRGPVEIEGLWGLEFGNGSAAGPLNTLFFAAGIDDEQHGLFGTITPIAKGANKK